MKFASLYVKKTLNNNNTTLTGYSTDLTLTQSVLTMVNFDGRHDSGYTATALTFFVGCGLNIFYCINYIKNNRKTNSNNT